MKKLNFYKMIVFSIVFMMGSVMSFAQPPNDLCSGAIPIVPSVGSYTCSSHTVTGATNSYTPTCAPPILEDIWFTFTANASTQVFELCGSSVGIVRLAIYSGSCGGLSEIYCNSQVTGGSLTVSGLTNGNSYYVSYDFTVAPGTIDIAIHSQTPQNDLCSGAIPIIPSYVNYSCQSYPVSGATNTFTSSCAPPILEDIWFTFIANNDTQVFELCASSVSNVKLTLYSGSCGSLSEVYCNAQSIGNSKTVTGLTAGNTYFVSYDFYLASGPTGNIDIAIHSQTPQNDLCSGAIPIIPSYVNYNCQSYPVSGATNTFTPSCAPPILEDIWFTFIANNDTQVFELCASSVGAVQLTVFSGSCGSLSEIYCHAQTAGNSKTVTGLTAGNTYYVSYDFVLTSGTIDIAIHSALPLPIDLVSFEALKLEKYNHLIWQSASEINSDYYQIERSEDGITWSKAEKVDANGTSFNNQNYQWKDYEIENGISYYRLKMVDVDGQFDYSEVKVIHRDVFQTLSVFPNPVTDKLYFSNYPFANAEMVKAEIISINNTGNLLQQTKFFKIKEGLDLSTYSKGIYILRLTTGTDKQVFKVIKD